jgi:RND family efflux transporter MFP subunit
LLLLAALGTAACGGGKSETLEKPRAIPVRTANVERRDLQEVLVLTGTLRPHGQVQVVAEVGARVLRILHDEGSRVQDGETLAVLDETDYRLSQDRAKAALAVADANQAHALAERDRADNLLKTGGITDKDRLSAEVNLKVAEASATQARAESAITAQQLARTQVKAPFGGRIAKRFVDVGAMLASGAPLFTLVDDSRLEFRAPVPSADWSKLQIGAEADVTVDAAPGLHSAGKVARLAPLVDERTRSFEVAVEVPGRKELVGGLFARATVNVGSVKDALVVPPGALLRDSADPSKADAFVVVAGQAQRRTVKLGTEVADAIQVTEGLAAGDVVVLSPPAALSTGSPVEAQAAGK